MKKNHYFMLQTVSFRSIGGEQPQHNCIHFIQGNTFQRWLNHPHLICSIHRSDKLRQSLTATGFFPNCEQNGLKKLAQGLANPKFTTDAIMATQSFRTGS